MTGVQTCALPISAGRENLRGEPRAGVVFRERELHVLGVPAPRRDAGCGGENWEVVVLKNYEEMKFMQIK